MELACRNFLRIIIVQGVITYCFGLPHPAAEATHRMLCGIQQVGTTRQCLWRRPTTGPYCCCPYLFRSGWRVTFWYAWQSPWSDAYRASQTTSCCRLPSPTSWSASLSCHWTSLMNSQVSVTLSLLWQRVVIFFSRVHIIISISNHYIISYRNIYYCEWNDKTWQLLCESLTILAPSKENTFVPSCLKLTKIWHATDIMSLTSNTISMFPRYVSYSNREHTIGTYHCSSVT